MALYKLIYSSFIYCIMVLASVQAEAAPVKIVVFGDSLTSGYQLSKDKAFSNILEQQLLSDGYSTQVINMSVVGETSAGGAARLDELLAAEPDIVIVQLGINDALRGIDPKHMLLNNLHNIIDTLRQRNLGVVLLGVSAPANVKQSYATTFKRVYQRTAERHRIAFHPDILRGVTSRPDLTLADGLHPNEKGVLAMVQNAYPYVEPLVRWRIQLQNHHNAVK